MRRARRACSRGATSASRRQPVASSATRSQPAGGPERTARPSSRRRPAPSPASSCCGSPSSMRARRDARWAHGVREHGLRGWERDDVRSSSRTTTVLRPRPRRAVRPDAAPARSAARPGQICHVPPRARRPPLRRGTSRTPRRRSGRWRPRVQQRLTTAERLAAWVATLRPLRRPPPAARAARATSPEVRSRWARSTSCGCAGRGGCALPPAGATAGPVGRLAVHRCRVGPARRAGCSSSRSTARFHLDVLTYGRGRRAATVGLTTPRPNGHPVHDDEVPARARRVVARPLALSASRSPSPASSAQVVGSGSH